MASSITILYPSTSFGFTADFRRHKQMLHIDEKAKRMLLTISLDPCNQYQNHLPEGNAQTPYGLHFETSSLRRANPLIAIVDLDPVFVKAAS